MFLGILIGAGMILLGYGLSYLITIGIIKLITLCFGWAFSWPIATGIWLVLVILEAFLKNKK